MENTIKVDKFNIEKAINGSKVITRNGFEVSQITFFNTGENMCVYGILNYDGNLQVESWSKDGSYLLNDKKSVFDLFLLAESK